MTAVGWLPADAEELFGTEATAEESYGVLTVDVPPASWITALEAARDRVGCTFFDWLSAVDEPGTGFRVTAHVAALAPVRRLLLRTTVPHEAPTLPSAVDVYAGAAWHERETHEMFGVDFTGHPGLDHLLLPDGFEGHPLRKDFVLAARVAKAWPGAKEPGEPAAGAAHGGPKRRQMLPPGVPDPNEWGPLKGQLPPAPARPARGAGRTAAGGGRAAGDRPAPDRPRRTRTAAEGSASQAATPEPPDQPTAPPRRMRTAAEGSASQGAEARPEAAAPPARRARSASEGSASQRSGTGDPRRARTASEGSASRRAAPGVTAASGEPAAAGDESTPAPTEGRPDRRPSVAPRSSDAPWHHARPAFARPETDDGTEPAADAGPAEEAATAPGPDAGPVGGAEAPAGSGAESESGAQTGSERAGTPDAGPVGGAEAPAGSGAESESGAQTGSERAGTPDAGPVGGAEAPAGSGAESDGARPEPGPAREPAPGPDTDAGPSTTPESGPEPAPEPDPEPDAAPGPRAGNTPETPTPEDPSGGPR
ncbi:NADH-quinone oxidoreductase subunit C [Streptomyces sp. NPDC012403]|uniref:NADH-quinone oxidoreductase subunit C n=1 Tax=Streptomyces sp. NPDC012403 TaxID=3364831 RepID=UPI0036E5AE71